MHLVNTQKIAVGFVFFSPFRVLIISCKLPAVNEYAKKKKQKPVHFKCYLYRGFSFTMCCKMPALLEKCNSKNCLWLLLDPVLAFSLSAECSLAGYCGQSWLLHFGWW